MTFDLNQWLKNQPNLAKNAADKERLRKLAAVATNYTSAEIVALRKKLQLTQGGFSEQFNIPIEILKQMEGEQDPL